MQWKNRIHGTWRIAATLVLVTYSVACTHMPTGEKAFDSFESCFAANLGLAAVGGVGIGALGSKLIGDITGNTSTGKKAGAAVGVAAGVMIAMHAWKQCAAVYNKSEVVTPPAARPVPTAATAATSTTQTPRLSLDRLEVHVEGSENDPPQPEFDFSLASENPAAKDIKAKFRHRVEIVRFKATDDDRLVLADEKGEALRDKSGKEIPLEAAARMPRDRLSWVPIAEEGKEDYVEDVVVQQGQRAAYRHKLKVPPRAQLPLPLPIPMRYTLGIEAENMTATRSVDFSVLGTAERPKRYSASAHASALSPSRVATPAAAAATAATSAAASGGATTNRKTTLFSDTTGQRKPVGSLAKGAHVRVEERITAIVNNRPAEWARVSTDGGARGWLPASHLSGGK